MQKYWVYELKVKTVDVLRTAFKNMNGNYHEADNGVIYIVTNDLIKAIKVIGEDNIYSIKKLGIGYVIDQEHEREETNDA